MIYRQLRSLITLDNLKKLLDVMIIENISEQSVFDFETQMNSALGIWVELCSMFEVWGV